MKWSLSSPPSLPFLYIRSRFWMIFCALMNADMATLSIAGGAVEDAGATEFDCGAPSAALASRDGSSPSSSSAPAPPSCCHTRDKRIISHQF